MTEHQQRDPSEVEPRRSPRIYVASLSDYNAGRLYGAWIEAGQSVEELEGEITHMLTRSSEPIAEEWAIHDYEDFGEVRLSEYESLATVSTIALGIHEHGDAFAAWAHLVDHDPEQLGQFDEAYRGSWSSVVAYAEELLDDIGATEALEALPSWLQPYVALDTEGFARDLELGGDIASIDHDSGTWIFDRHG